MRTRGDAQKVVAGQWESELGKVKTQLAEKDNLLVVHRNNIEYFKMNWRSCGELNALQEKLKIRMKRLSS